MSAFIAMARLACTVTVAAEAGVAGLSAAGTAVSADAALRAVAVGAAAAVSGGTLAVVLAEFLLEPAIALEVAATVSATGVPAAVAATVALVAATLAGRLTAVIQLEVDQLAGMIPRLRTFNDIPALRSVLQRLGPPARMPIPALITAASHLTYANLAEEAIAYLDEARRADPHYPPTLLARAQVRAAANRSTWSRRNHHLSRRVSFVAGIRPSRAKRPRYWALTPTTKLAVVESSQTSPSFGGPDGGRGSGGWRLASISA